MRVGKPDPLMQFRSPARAGFRYARVRSFATTLALRDAPRLSSVDDGLTSVFDVSCSTREEVKDEVIFRCA